MAKLIIILVITVAYVSADCSYDELKKCYNLENMFSDGNINWPTDDAGVQTLCGKLLEGGACVKVFSDNCNKNDDAKKRFNERIGALKMYHGTVCGSEGGRKGFLDRVQCYSNPQVMSTMREAHKRYVAMVETIATLDKGTRKQAFCCSLLYLKDTAKGPVTANCKKETVDYLKNLLSLVSATFKQECGSNTEYKACSAALPGGVGGQLDAIANAASAPATSNKLAFPTLFKMWQES